MTLYTKQGRRYIEAHGIEHLQDFDRLMPSLHTFSLAAGSLELDNLLHSSNGMGTADVRRALGMA